MASWLQQVQSKFKFECILQLAGEDWHDAYSEAGKAIHCCPYEGKTEGEEEVEGEGER